MKVLDFGLAKALGADRRIGADRLAVADDHDAGDDAGGHDPRHGGLHEPGAGARAGRSDKRTDIWAFGCVLYEMLTGHAAFEGEDVTDDVGARRANGNLTSTHCPPRCQRGFVSHSVCAFRRIRSNALTTLQTYAWRWTGAFETIVTTSAMAAPLHHPLGWRRSLVPFATLVIGGVIVGGAVWFATRAAPARVVRTEIATAGAAALSIRGRSRHCHHTRWLAHRLSGPEPTGRACAGPTGTHGRSTEGLGAPRGPFVSPDGQWVGFFDGNLLKKVAIGRRASNHACHLMASPMVLAARAGARTAPSSSPRIRRHGSSMRISGRR